MEVREYGAHAARLEGVAEIAGDGGGVVGRALWARRGYSGELARVQGKAASA